MLVFSDNLAYDSKTAIFYTEENGSPRKIGP
jgi:hypothetical protein